MFYALMIENATGDLGQSFTVADKFSRNGDYNLSWPQKIMSRFDGEKLYYEHDLKRNATVVIENTSGK